MKTFEKKFNIALFIELTLLGLILITGCIYGIIYNTTFKKTAIKTQAKIVDITKHYSIKGTYGLDTHHTVYVEFKVDNQVYSGELNSYSSNMYIGKYTDIYYDPLNPYNFRTASNKNNIASIIFFAIATILSFIGLRGLFKHIVSNNLKNKLIQTGTIVMAKFDRVELNVNYSVNGIHPYRIICHSIDTEYFSNNILQNPECFIQDKGITHFSVYIDPKNPKKYYMPLDELSELLN